MTDAGSEFQTDGAAHRKERFAKWVRANGWMSRGVAVERVRALTRPLMRWLRYRGTDVFRVLYVRVVEIVSSTVFAYPYSSVTDPEILTGKKGGADYNVSAPS